jgi:hypothetical protein
MDELKLRIKTQNETRDYNLATSLKSYIDPRIYYKWGKEIDYYWKRYYPKALQRKFSWVETDRAPHALAKDACKSELVNGGPE